MHTLASVYQSVFQTLDRRIEDRWNAGNLSHGFWRSGSIPALVPVDTLREYGFWQAKADLSGMATACEGMAGQVSVSLVGGHTRIGLFLPARLLDGISVSGESLTDAVSKAHDGRPASIVRRLGGDTLFDRILTDPPFSADWLLTCTSENEAQTILENHLAWRVIDLWESALRSVLSRQSPNIGIVIHSVRPLPPVITESLPLTVHDAYEIHPGRWVTVVTMDDGTLGDTMLETRLQALLPDHRITIHKDLA